MKIDHVAMYVNDLEAEKDFFVKYFNASSNDGYHNPAKKFRSYFLTFNGGSRLELMNKAEMDDAPKTLNRTGFIHMALSVGDKTQVDELTARLKADGIKVIGEPRTTGDGYYEAVVVDPEGNLIEVVAGSLIAKK